MDTAAIFTRLKGRFGDQVSEGDPEAKERWITVQPSIVADVCDFLKDERELAFDALSNQSGVDYKDRDVVQVVYHLYSYSYRHSVVLKVEAPRQDPVVPTVEHVWRAANWLEREIFDLLGVTFAGHSDLRRLLMPEDWVGYPLRKDFVEPQDYHGINTRRESLLK